MNDRKPTIEEYQAALKNGEIDSQIPLQVNSHVARPQTAQPTAQVTPQVTSQVPIPTVPQAPDQPAYYQPQHQQSQQAFQNAPQPQYQQTGQNQQGQYAQPTQQYQQVPLQYTQYPQYTQPSAGGLWFKHHWSMLVIGISALFVLISTFIPIIAGAGGSISLLLGASTPSINLGGVQAVGVILLILALAIIAGAVVSMTLGNAVVEKITDLSSIFVGTISLTISILLMAIGSAFGALGASASVGAVFLLLFGLALIVMAFLNELLFKKG
ncbi:MAG: hypothetical protein LBI43_00135 [Streptococcaceae bacterium]|nr:hypothetical protein [Streptococcaceae bacterium]